MSAVLMHIHLAGLKVVELFANGRLVFWSQPRPRFIGPPIVLVTGCHLNIVTKFDYLPILEFVNRGSKAKFSQQVSFLFFALLFELLTGLFF